MKTRIGVICPSNIAFRRFLPALLQCGGFEYAGVAYAASKEWFGGSASDDVIAAEKKKAQSFADSFGGEVFEGYDSLFDRADIDAVYLPLPPALHFEWAKKALQKGKHVFVEKPSTTSLADTKALVALARKNDLALHENYMFVYHRQIDEILRIVRSGELGELRLIRASFGFPFRGAQDFRYDKALGGGALLDCGGYPIRLARLLLGDTATLKEGFLSTDNSFGVDLFGNAVLRNNEGLTAHVAFGMDNSYQCKLEVWGSKGCLSADRVFTPPADLCPEIVVQTADGTKKISVAADDQFCNSIGVFEKCIFDRTARQARFEDIVKQSEIIDGLKRCGAEANK